MKAVVGERLELKVEGVCFSYREGREILKDVYFEAKDRELVGILGPNGAGKTTLIRVIAGGLSPTKGAVWLNGRKVHEIPPQELAREVAVLPQTEPIVNHITVKDMVLLGRTPYLSPWRGRTKKDVEKAREVLRMVGMEDFWDRSMASLSGGERQRVLIARALAQEPRLLLLDEPTVHLDLAQQLEVLSLLKELREKGLCIICVLHDINLASLYCDRLLLMKDGRIYKKGTPEEVITRESLGEVFNIHVRVHKHPLTSRPYITLLHMRPRKKGRRVHVVSGGGMGEELMRRLTEEGFAVSAGVLNVGDSDYETAERLGIDCAEEAPFAPISERAHRRNLELMSEAEAIIVAPVAFGWGNLKNLEAVVEMQKKGKRIFIASNDWEASDFTGGEAKGRIEELLSNGAQTYSSPEELLKLL